MIYGLLCGFEVAYLKLLQEKTPAGMPVPRDSVLRGRPHPAIPALCLDLKSVGMVVRPVLPRSRGAA